MKKFIAILSACVGVFGLAVAGHAQQAQTPPVAPSTSYRLRPLDVVQMKVFQEPDLDTVYKIGNNGCIVLPLVGTVKVGGLTLQDAQRLVKELYEKDYLVKAEVSLFIAE